MGKSSTKKSAKGRLDKYYKLAKEQGYRARSAFKLIQLNRKYEFLNSAKFCIDLCAAPGGWLQVASKQMPLGGLILGCDLDPIKPIPRVITFQSDITTPQCRHIIRSHAKDWLADVILHDGAPNVGKAWLQDAYTQSELVLSSLKLAVEFLRKGGTFISKVFRSKDYNNLMWVFNQLFGKVEATKPPSSRDVSAEIFVICQNFLAPAHIDPKFLDPKHVFKDVVALPPVPIVDDATSVNTEAKLKSATINPKLGPNAISLFKSTSGKMRHREGYADDVTTLFKSGSASQFILGNASTAISFLGDINRIDFNTTDEKLWYDLRITDDDIKANCADLKVLGKREFQRLLKWRGAIREHIGLDAPNEVPAEEFIEASQTMAVDPDVEDEEIQRDLEQLTAREMANRKRERRKKNERRQKEVIRQQLRMTAPMDIGLETQDPLLGGPEGYQDEVFDLGRAENPRARRVDAAGVISAYDSGAESTDEEIKTTGVAEFFDSDEEKEAKLTSLEAEIDGLYEAYMQKMMEKDAKYRIRQNRAKDKARSDVWDGIHQQEGTRIPDPEVEGDSDASIGGWEYMLAKREKIGESESEESDDDDKSSGSQLSRTKRCTPSVSSDGDHDQPSKHLIQSFKQLSSIPSASKSAQVWFQQDVFKALGDINEIIDADDASPAGSKDVSRPREDSTDLAEKGNRRPHQIKDNLSNNLPLWSARDEDLDKVKEAQIQEFGLLTPEAVTLAQRLVNRQITRTHLINEGFNKHSFQDRIGLPDWFLSEEKSHYGVSLPVTKEAVRMLRDKQRALNARPMKKIAEARARKKMRAVRRLQKASKLAEGVTGDGDLNERQKAEAMQKIMGRGTRKVRSQQPVTTIVSKGRAGGAVGRPKGVKGRIRLVDPRQKKDLRGEKRAAKAKKKRKA